MSLKIYLLAEILVKNKKQKQKKLVLKFLLTETSDHHSIYSAIPSANSQKIPLT